jgi:catechol 2,3-dioxygenase-like lactoylglutathione lyase family enzyme
MPRFHHVNLGVPPDAIDAEEDFLIDVLGYRRMEIPSDMQQFQPKWFEADDGSQVHLSVDPEHRVAARAHTAIELAGETDEVERRLGKAGIDFKTFGDGDARTLFCVDPAGNRWELRA